MSADFPPCGPFYYGQGGKKSMLAVGHTQGLNKSVRVFYLLLTSRAEDKRRFSWI
jgi:hypothetical protein